MIKRVYEVDPLVCPTCGETLKLRSFVDAEDEIFRILSRLELLADGTPNKESPTAGRDPPFHEPTVEPFYDDLPLGDEFSCA